MSPELIKFLKDNKDLINENIKESWEQIYSKLKDPNLKGEFTQTILDTGIEDPARIMGKIPEYYLFSSKITDYKIPDNVTSIGNRAFSSCSSLTSVEIPSSVTSIGGYAFYYCKSLTRVVIGDGVKSIDDYAFYECTNIKDMYFVGNPEKIFSILSKLSLWSRQRQVYVNGESIGDVTIPPGITSIGLGMFQGCTNLVKVVIPDTVRTIAEGAFNNCSNLRELYIPDSVKKVASHIVDNCPKLESVTVPSVAHLRSWGFTHLFENGTDLYSMKSGSRKKVTQVEVPEASYSLTPFPYYSGCTSLENIYWGAHLDTRDLTNCKNLKNLYLTKPWYQIYSHNNRYFFQNLPRTCTVHYNDTIAKCKEEFEHESLSWHLKFKCTDGEIEL